MDYTQNAACSINCRHTINQHEERRLILFQVSSNRKTVAFSFIQFWIQRSGEDQNMVIEEFK
uniref:Uncharacterized protein n=1 Tax=Onchocerca volvulus TaxID=6282 RepID=A0A8R1XWF3_ONCVO